jgi:hypothetical protein
LRIGADKTKRISAKIGRLRVIRVLLTRAFFYTLNFHGLRYSRDKYFDAAPSPSILSVLAFHMIRWPDRSATFPSRHVVVERCPISMSEVGLCRDLTQSRKLRTCVSVVFARRLNHLAPFVHGARDGLLDVNVFARLTGRHGLQRVPVVGRSDDHRVNVPAVEDSAKIPVGLDAFEFGVIDREVYLRLEDVADRDNLRVRIPHKRLHHAAPLTSGANHADANAIIRAQNIRASRSRDADSADALLDEISAFDSVVHILLRINVP